MCEIEKPSSHISAAFTVQSSGSIGLCLVRQTRPLCIASYAISVRQTESLPVSALRSLHIRLPSDSTSRWTPLPSANSSYCQVCGGLSPPSYCPCRAHENRRQQDAKFLLAPVYIYVLKICQQFYALAEAFHIAASAPGFQLNDVKSKMS